MRLKYVGFVVLLGMFYLFSNAVYASVNLKPVKGYSNITLEMSLKPFKKNDKAYIRSVCQHAFQQWQSLLQHADTVSVMLWTSDGSEILDYSGDLNQELEWAKYIGNPNAPHPINSGPRSLTLHDRAYTYIEEPPVFSYGDLKFIVQTIKEEGRKATGKPIRVGATFDPGPEFAISTFKYKRHPEICMANTMGTKSFVVCYATLNADDHHYAAYPDGIPQGTLFGTFLGKQSTAFLGDLGFDYLWLSNGFGFGMETWNTIGAIFDGKEFHGEKMGDIQSKILLFWTSFREGCPDFRVETRGTNLSAGIDLARDGVDLKSIYNGNFNILPPPNSPWAALDGDFGLELTGFMSRMAELPDDRYIFRFYTHDPWWANSPWLDRYGRESHDIYMPMAVTRINSKGEIKLPTHLNFLSIDDSYGNMPDQVPDEVIPHILQARRNAPDAAGQVVWVYPFDEYHHYAFNDPSRLEEIFYGDWFVRQAINDGFPMNTVVSTTNFASLMEQGSKVFDASVLVTVVPDEGSNVDKQLINFVKKGGKLMLYGPAGHASREFLDFINVKLTEPLTGTFKLKSNLRQDQVKLATKIRHDANMSGGGIETLISNKKDKATWVMATVSQGSKKRDVVVLRENKDWNGGAVCYIRGTNSATYTGGMLLSNDDPGKWFIGGSMMRYALSEMGYSIFFNKKEAGLRNPVNCISKHGNGYYFSGYVPNQTIEQHFRFPQGAPVFTGTETLLVNGSSTYRMPKSWNKECRVFVEQTDGIVACREMAPVEFNIKRKIGITGLRNATVRVYPEGGEYYKAMPQNNHYPAKEIILESKKSSGFDGNYYEYKNVNGELVITW